MSCDLSISRGRQCKGLGGNSETYIFPYVQYLDSQIVRTNLTLTTFPATTVYQFFAENVGFSNPSLDQDGGKYYSESVNLTFPKIEVNTELVKLLRKDYRMILKDRNGLYRLLGAYKGGEFDNLTQTTGGSHSELTGYTIDYEATEEIPALYFTSLSGVGFTVSA